MNKVIELINNHRSIRKFTAQTVEQSQINKIIQAGQAASTSSFMQTCTVIQVNDRDKRAALAASTGNQKCVIDASVFLVFCADIHRHHLVCNRQNIKMQQGFTEHFIIATVDCSLFAQNVAIVAESEGLGIVYIGGIRNDIERVKEILILPDQVYPVFGMCLGYPDQNPEVKPRLPLEVVLKQDVYTEPSDIALIKEYDKKVSTYYKRRTANKESLCWTEQIVAKLQQESRPELLEALNKSGFLLR